MKKILIAIFAFALLLVVAAIVLPYLLKDKIVAKAKDAINNSIEAKVDFGDVGLSLFHDFPNLSFCIGNLSVVGKNEFDGDTLAYISSLNLNLNLWDVIGGSKISINSVELDKPYVNIIVLENGKANYDIAKPSSAAASSASSSFNIAITSYAITNGLIKYNDQYLNLKLLLSNLKHRGSGDFTADLFTLITKTEIEKTTLWYGGVKYISSAKATLTATFEIDNKNSKYTFKDNELQLNELVFGVNGWVAMPEDDIAMDLKWGLKKNDFKNIVSMIPAVYNADYKNLKTSGTIEMNGFILGTYNDVKMPAYDLVLKIDKGMFQYPSLPSSVNNVNVDLKISNPDGVTDHTVIDLRSMHAEIANSPIDARLHVINPFSDPNIDAMLKGKMDLKNVKNIVPLEKGTDLNGLVTADVTAKGLYSSIEKKQYADFNAAGTFSIAGMSYKSEGYPTMLIDNLAMSFNPQNVTLNNFDAQLGKSDLHAEGSIENLLGYYFKSELLKGRFLLNSSLIDLNEWMTGSSTANTTSDTSSMTVIEIPANVDFTIGSSIKKILYENKVIENLKGDFTVVRQDIEMQKVIFNMLNGSVSMSGNYATPNPLKPVFNYSLSIKDFDLQKSFKTFVTVQKMAPVIEQCAGNYSTDLIIKGTLDQHMQPEMNSLSGKGKFTSDKVVINNFEPLNKIADALKMDEYKKAEVENINFSYEFENGRVKVKPYETKIAGTKAVVEGSSGFDQSIDYKVGFSIPKEKLGTQATSMMSDALSKANGAAGTSFQLPDPIKVNVHIGGTVLKPEVKTDFAQQGQSIVSAVKEEVEQQVETKVEDVKQQTRYQAAKIMADAEIEAQKIRDAAKVTSDKTKAEGFASADKLVAQTTNAFAKVAAQEAAKKAKAETDKQAQKIIDEGNKQAQAVLDAAKKKSDELFR